MTSKEALENIKNQALNDIDSIPLFAVDLCKSINQEVEKAYNIVLKDLEILEAIKNKAQNNRFFRGCLLRMFCETKKTPNGIKKEKIKDEHFDTIKRWLDE